MINDLIKLEIIIYLTISCLGNKSIRISLTTRAKGNLGMRKCVVFLKYLISFSTWLFFLNLFTKTLVCRIIKSYIIYDLINSYNLINLINTQLIFNYIS